MIISPKKMLAYKVILIWSFYMLINFYDALIGYLSTLSRAYHVLVYGVSNSLKSCYNPSNLVRRPRNLHNFQD